MSVYDDRKYLIIGGTTKAATTSLFFYLSEHPQVCASSMKETRFFLDPDYPVKSKYRFEDGLEKYQEFFSHCSDKKLIRLEATPDYLYSQNTARKIFDSFPNALVVFVLREPRSRLISWFRFAKQRGLLSTEISLDEYIKTQLHNPISKKTPQHMRALEQGCYSIYLKNFYNLLEPERILITFFEDLKRNPISVVKNICDYSDIAPTYYEEFDFKIYNPTRNLRNPKINKIYNQIQLFIRHRTHNKQAIHGILKRIRLLLDSFYFPIDKNKKSENMFISPDLSKLIDDYYEIDRQDLENLIQRKIPWN